MIRLFAGLELPPDTRQMLDLLRGGIDGAKWRREDQFHLTLRFIGEVEPQQADDIRMALDDVAFRAFTVRLSGLGLFGRMPVPRVLWVGVEDPAPLRHLHDRIGQRLLRLGLAPEGRKYSPHVTLAHLKGRPRRLRRWLADHEAFTAPPFKAASFALFRSHLLAEGARYEVAARYPASDAEPVVHSDPLPSRPFTQDTASPHHVQQMPQRESKHHAAERRKS